MTSLTVTQISVVLVEPSKTQQRIVCNYLHDIGVVSIKVVSNGQDAINELQVSPPDLIISAMHLSDMTGTELVQTMRMDESSNQTPFMLISSETHYRYLEPIRQAGVIAILEKPFSKEQLKKALEATLDYIDPGEVGSRHFSSEELCVLVVDDSYTARRHICRVLRNMGIENLVEAENGEQALQLVHDQFFDLVVTDFHMPVMNGKELIEHIRGNSNQAGIPILMVSSEREDSRIASVQQAGVSAICDKPFEANTVKQIIEKIVA